MFGSLDSIDSKSYLNYRLMLDILGDEQRLQKALKLYPCEEEHHEIYDQKKKIMETGIDLAESAFEQNNTNESRKNKQKNKKNISTKLRTNVKKLLGVIFLNTFTVSSKDEFQVRKTLLFETMSRFNHDCWPNCSWSIDSNSGQIVVKSISKIETGNFLSAKKTASILLSHLLFLNPYHIYIFIFEFL